MQRPCGMFGGRTSSVGSYRASKHALCDVRVWWEYPGRVFFVMVIIVMRQWDEFDFD